MKIRILVMPFLALMAAFILSLSVSAQSGSQFPYASKESCTQSYYLNTGNSSATAAEAFCKNKYPDPILICAQQKLTTLKKTKTVAASDEPNYINKFKEECIKVGVNSSSSTSAATAAATGSSSPTMTQQEYQAQFQAQQAQAAAAARAQAAAGNNRNSPSTAAQTANLLRATAPAINAAEKAYDKATVEEKKSQPTESDRKPTAVENKNAESSASSGETNLAAPVKESRYEDAEGNTYRVYKDAADGKQVIEKTDKSGEITLADKVPEGAKNVQPTPKAEADAAEAATKRAAAGADEVGKDSPQLKGPAEKAAGTLKDAPKPPKTEEISVAAKNANEVLKKSVESIVNAVKPQMDVIVHGSDMFINTKIAFDSTKQEIERYAENTKNYCTEAAEKTEFLCVEGTSPPALATKAFMETAGPALALINSAQQSCSSTAKVTRFASNMLTAAKSICAAAKLTCDGLCALAVSDLNKTVATLESKLSTALANDLATSTAECQATSNSKAASHCSAATAGYAACYAAAYQDYLAVCEMEVESKESNALAAKQQIIAAIQKENALSPGTTPSLAKKCQMKIRDITQLAVNILGTVAAQKSAEECERKLSSSGSLSTQQYCAMAGNSTTQFCKCQRDNTQEGCSGYVAMNGSTTNINALSGTNIKSDGSSTSSFASGGLNPNIKPTGDISLPTNLAENSSSGSNTPDSLLNNSNGGRGSSGSSAGSFGGSGLSSGSGSAAANNIPKKETDKKWSFGAFANKVGSLFKSGGSNGKGSKVSVNGSLSSKSEALAKRRLASEKIQAEVTQSSGKSNWDKVHRTYTLNESTFISGQ